MLFNRHKSCCLTDWNINVHKYHARTVYMRGGGVGGSFNWSHVFSLVLSGLQMIIVLLSLSRRFSLRKFKEWLTAQLASFAKLQNLPASLFILRSSLATNQQSHSIQYRSHLLRHCLWYSSSISLWVAPSPYTLPPCSEDGQKDSGREILSIHRTCDLELSLSLPPPLSLALSLLFSQN